MKINLLKQIALYCVILLSVTNLYAKDVSLSSYLENPSYENLNNFKSEKKILNKVINLHEKNKGATYNIRWGNLENQDLYVVSLFPDLSVVIDSMNVDEKTLKSFLEKNIKLLLNPRCAIGTWYNTADKKTYLDVSTVFFDKNLAIEIAKQYNQIAIWNLKNMQEIKTGGTGEAIKNLPNPEDRIPPIKF